MRATGHGAARADTKAVRRLGSVLVGAVAGAAGLAAMDVLWYRRYRRGGGTDSPLEWEFAAATKTWDDVSAPGQVGHLALRRLAGGREVPDRWARPTQNVVHWAIGMGWGAQLGAVGAGRRPRWWWGPVLGGIAWAASYAILPFVGVYKPIWEYDADTLGQDLSAHLLYGGAAGVVYAASARRA